MKRIAVFTFLGATLVLLLNPSAAFARSRVAGAPFGSFGGISTGANGATGTVPLTGWALAADGVFAVDIVVDGGIIDQASYGRQRPIVAVEYPGYPDSNAAGFAYQLDTTHFLNGLHQVSARVQSRTGLVTYLNAVTIQFTNLTADLIPFGKIDFPNPQAELAGNCDLGFPGKAGGFYNVIDGWALDPGVQAQDQPDGVVYVEMLIDRSLTGDPTTGNFFNTQDDCHYSTPEGGYSDCYGLRRDDIEAQFPGLKDAPHAGFRFVLDVGKLLSETDGYGTPLYTPGSHLLTIRVGDVFEQVTNIAEFPVFLTCIDFTQNTPSIGQITNPVPGMMHNGTVLVAGWALDLEGVNAVVVEVDGVPQGIATYGFPDPNISAFYPSYPNTPDPGWLFALDTTQLSNGYHELEAFVVDDTGAQTFIGKFRFDVANVIQ
jgi:Bacterial Ig domain